MLFFIDLLELFNFSVFKYFLEYVEWHDVALTACVNLYGILTFFCL